MHLTATPLSLYLSSCHLKLLTCHSQDSVSPSLIGHIDLDEKAAGCSLSNSGTELSRDESKAQFIKKNEGLLCWSSGQDSSLTMQGAWVRSLVGELRSHMLRIVAKNK